MLALPPERYQLLKTLWGRQKLNSKLFLDMSQLNMMRNGGLLMLRKYFLKVMKYLSTSFIQMDQVRHVFTQEDLTTLSFHVDDILIQLGPTTITGQTYHLSEDDT